MNERETKITIVDELKNHKTVCFDFFPQKFTIHLRKMNGSKTKITIVNELKNHEMTTE